MSWQTYIDTSLLGTGNVSAGCILGRADGAVYAASAGYGPTSYEATAFSEDGTENKVTINEAASMVAVAATAAQGGTSLPVGGFRIGGQKWQVIGRKKGKGGTTMWLLKGRGSGYVQGVAIFTHRCIIIAVCDASITPSACHEAADNLGEYLFNAQY